MTTSEYGKTADQFEHFIGACRKIFEQKTQDYGTAWRILRPTSITDQIFIKASRIRTIQEKQTKKVDEGVESEFKGIINYAIIALIQLELGRSDGDSNLTVEETMNHFNTKAQQAGDLMNSKNHDYGEAWRSMRVESITDLILMKLLRVKQIEDNDGATLISEGLDANYLDILNYAIFALILLEEQ